MSRMAAEMASLRNEIEILHEGRAAFIEELTVKVADLRDGFRTAHAAMARAGNAERKAFVTTLRRMVGDFRRAFAAEMSAMHAAWVGNGSSAHVHVKKAEHSAKQKSKG